jgi:serine phosphatase RsbU (regulator of sigma subunit)
MMQSKQNAAFLSVVVDGPRYQALVANAGLIAPLLWRDGVLCYIDSFGLPLGALHMASYVQQIVPLRPGDCMLLISDGVVEAMNDARELWGFERLESAFGAVGGQHPSNVIESLLADIRAFTGDAPQHDDMTLVALQILPDLFSSRNLSSGRQNGSKQRLEARD